MDTDPIPRSHRDRRTTPRRAEDVAAHYTRELLIAAALAVVDFDGDAPGCGSWDGIDEEHAAILDGLTSAAEQYRRAAAALVV